MKHKTLFTFCSLLLIVGIMFALIAVWGNKTDLEDANASWKIYNDIPVIRASSAAYLLNENFTATPENFSDCVKDYFSAPAMLYFDIGYYPEPTWAIKDPAKAAAFADAFRDISLTPISSEEYPAIRDHSKWFCFVNAIGQLSLYEQNETTYITFLGSHFRTEDDLLSDVNAISDNLKAYAKEIPEFEMPH